jgi:hypothetical protein
MLKYCAANRNRRLSALPNVIPYIQGGPKNVYTLYSLFYMLKCVYISFGHSAYTTLNLLALQGAPYIYIYIYIYIDEISRLRVNSPTCFGFQVPSSGCYSILIYKLLQIFCVSGRCGLLLLWCGHLLLLLLPAECAKRSVPLCFVRKAVC